MHWLADWTHWMKQLRYINNHLRQQVQQIWHRKIHRQLRHCRLQIRSVHYMKHMFQAVRQHSHQNSVSLLLMGMRKLWCCISVLQREIQKWSAIMWRWQENWSIWRVCWMQTHRISVEVMRWSQESMEVWIAQMENWWKGLLHYRAIMLILIRQFQDW